MIMYFMTQGYNNQQNNLVKIIGPHNERILESTDKYEWKKKVTLLMDLLKNIVEIINPLLYEIIMIYYKTGIVPE